MIVATSEREHFLTSFTNGRDAARADAAVDKGGGDAGFRPHDLLEASIASCINIWLRMYSTSHSVPLERVVTTVEADRTDPAAVTFKYSVEVSGPLTAEQRQKLLDIAAICPVRRTLERTISFVEVPAPVGDRR